MRLCFLRILDESVRPREAGALVDVWHVSPGGKYSGNDAEHEDVGFCTGDDPAFSAASSTSGASRRTDAARPWWPSIPAFPAGTTAAPSMFI